MSALTVHYFPLRARAEATKLMLAYANHPYELNTISFPDWGGGVKGEQPFTPLLTSSFIDHQQFDERNGIKQ